jgi:alkaline phosphatase
VNWGTKDHTGIDVPTTAHWPMSDQLSGTNDNNEIINEMHSYIGWEIWMPMITK